MNTHCQADGCQKATRNRDRYCDMHRARLRLHGDLNHARPSTLERIIEKVDASGDCWLWTGCVTRKGYGAYGKHAAPVHRVLYAELVGPIPEGMTLDHLCRNTLCVNPDHLEPVDGVTNTMRGFSPFALNARKTHCPQGHPYTGRNVYVERGSRMCRLCHNAKIARQKANKLERAAA